MRHSFVILVTFSFISLTSAQAAEKQEWRCGWFDNPSPANVTLIDRDGEWLISMQGHYEAKGEWPQFKDHQWVHSNGGSYGHGCACIRGLFDLTENKVISIEGTKVKPLSACRDDKALKNKEPPA